jgi:GT2 family glycosyltransferase
VKEEIPDVLVTVLYHSKLGGNFSKMLESLANVKPYNSIILLFIDNYSRDGAHDLVNLWIDRYGERYKGIIHVRAKGNPARLRNIALKLGYDIGVKYLSFIDSDVIVDESFLIREFELMKEYHRKNVISVSAVRYTPYEYLDFFEKCITKWLRGRNTVNAGVFEGEAFNSGNCLIDLSKVPEVGWFDEDIVFIEDLDWGRRATRRGFVCLFDGRVQLLHMKKYSVKDLRKYFFKGALSEAKLFLKNRLAKAALRRISYWNGLFLSMLIVPITLIPFLILLGIGWGTYAMRSMGWGRLLLYPILTPVNIAKSLALGLAMLYWLIRGGYSTEKVTVLDSEDWEVEYIK